MTVIIRELQNNGSYRGGTTKKVKDLTAAKIIASKNQCFQGTVLAIEAEDGRRLATKENGVWR